MVQTAPRLIHLHNCKSRQPHFLEERTAPAGILVFSGFLPTVEGWQPDVARSTKVFLAHGRLDPVMDVEFARAADRLLRAAGMDVEYLEGDGGHWIEPDHAAQAAAWLARTLET